MPRIRDFIYLDVDRVRSLVAQLEEGVVDSFSKSLGSTSSAKGGVKGGIIGLVSGDVGVEQLWRSDAHENRSLNDYIFTRLEDLLVKEGLVRTIKHSVSAEDAKTARAALSPTDFLLIDATVELNDLARMNSLLRNFNELGKFFAYTSIQDEPDRKKMEARIRAKLNDPDSGLQIDKQLQEGLSLVIENLLSEQIILRAMPFSEVGGPSFIGTLMQDWLREKMNVLLIKYGSRPSERWKVFCQVASLNPNTAAGPEVIRYEEGLSKGLLGMFDAIRALDRVVMPYANTDVTVTPIAVYREAE